MARIGVVRPLNLYFSITPKIHSFTLVSFCLLFAFLILSPVSAQVGVVNNTTMTPTFGVGHDYIQALSETVNPANGSVSVRIPGPVPPARGITTPRFLFNYDSNNAFGDLTKVLNPIVTTSCNAGFCSSQLYQVTWRTPTNVGVPLSLDNVNLSQQPDAGGPTFNCRYLTDYVYTDVLNQKHPLGLVRITSDSPTGSCAHFGIGAAGITVGGDIQAKAELNAATGAVYITDAHGTIYDSKDSNGNVATGGTASAPKDTLGRTVYTTSGNSVTYSGISSPFVYTNSTQTWNYNVNASFLPTVSAGNCAASFAANTGSATVITQIKLPNNQTFQFAYESTHGLLKKITYPSGATVTYTWNINSQSEAIGFSNASSTGATLDCRYRYDGFAVTKRQVSFDGVTTALQQDFSYSTQWSGSTASWTSKQTIVTTHDLLRPGQPTFQTIYNYSPIGAFKQPFDYSLFTGQIPQESTIVYKDVGGATLKTVLKSWLRRDLLASECLMLDNGQTAGTFYTYATWYSGAPPGAQYIAVPLSKKEFDYGQVVSGTCQQPSSTPARETVTTYASFANTPSFPGLPSILDRPSTVKVYGNGTLLAETDYAYDQTAVTPVSALTGHDDVNYSSSYNNRGNLTTKTQRCFVGATNCTDSVTKYTYDITGQVLTIIDPCGSATCSDMTGTSHTTNYSYVDRFSSGTPPGTTNAYVTQITNPLGHMNTYTYGYDDGQLTASTDPNGKTTQYLYNDALRRITEVDYPDTGKATFSYNDAPPMPSVTQAKVVDTSPLTQLSTTTVMDGMGHIIQTQLTTDPEGIDYTDTTYDGNGHIRTVSNPHRSTAASTDGTASYDYDALGRLTKITRPDGATVLTTYAGRATDVMDEGANGAGSRRVERVSQTDALGRLASVCEVTNATQLGSGGTPATCTQDITKTGFVTNYSYDALGNLLSVSQGTIGQRTFAYNSLSRLLCASNPETATATCPTPDSGSYTAGTIRYSYDANGNMASRIAPKPNQTNPATTVTTSYQYDVLSRLLIASYNDGVTPTVTNTYDQSTETGAANIIGRRTSASVTSSSTLIDRRLLVTYDPVGRLQLEYQCAPDLCVQDRYNVSYTYNQAGDEKTLSAGFPGAGSQTQTNLYTAANRLQKVTTTLAAFPILDSILYTPAGALRSASVGPSMAESWAYNNRGWLTSIAAAGPGSGGLQNFYTEAPGYAPNGNVTSLNDSVNGNWVNTYDDFNRLATALAANVSEGCSFGYDRYGNRWQESPFGSGNSCNNRPLAFNANNHITTYSYDAAGNQLSDGAHNYTYDAENRVRTVDGSISYVYDADGRRVAKKNGSAFTAEYILDQTGRELAQLDGGGNLIRGEIYAAGRHVGTYNNQGLYFTFLDHLDTERSRRNADGSALETCKNLPFGDGQACSGTDVSALHFTGKERDTESGLDNFGARYDASSLGRFMTPDPVSATPLHLVNPQRWNMYAYVVNNPLTYIDPDGRDAIAVNFVNEVLWGGHAGIIVVHADGSATYARFGPAHAGSAADKGKVTVQALNPVKFGSNGLPTDAAYKELSEQVAKIESFAGDTISPSTVGFNYFKTSEADSIALDNWMQQWNTAQAPNYSVTSQNCATFCIAGLIKGRAIENKNISIIPNRLFMRLSGLAAENWTWEGRKPNPEPNVQRHTEIHCLRNRDGSCAQ